MHNIGHANCALGRAAIIEFDDEGHEVGVWLLQHDKDPEYRNHTHINLEKFLGPGIIDIWQDVTDPNPKILHYLRTYATLVHIGQYLDPNLPFETRSAVMDIVEAGLQDTYIHDFVANRLLGAHPDLHLVRALDEIPEPKPDQHRMRDLIRAIRERWCTS